MLVAYDYNGSFHLLLFLTSGFQSTGISQGFPQDELDLRIRASEFIGCPFFERIEQSGIDPDYESLARSHIFTSDQLKVSR